MIDAKRGMEFSHARWLDANNAPLRCRVTAIRHGRVYWRPVLADGSLGHARYCAAERFAESVGVVLGT